MKSIHESYNQAIEQNPNDADAYYHRGLAYQSQPDYAILDYNKAIRLRPDFAEAYHYRGDAYLAKADYDNAISDYTQVLKLKPNYSFAYFPSRAGLPCKRRL